MSIIVETGAGVTDANSYADLAKVRAYALLRGITLSTDDAVVTAQIMLGMDFIEAKRSDFQGTKTSATQALQWPRKGVTIDCNDVDENTIPNEIVNALCQVVIEQHNGVNLSPTRTDAFITEDTIGPITTKYSDKIGGGPGTAPTMPNVENSLAPLLATCGQVAGSISVVRV